MICPQCGYELGTAHKCMRCGYEIKTLVTVDETRHDDSQQNNNTENETRVIDPRDVYISSGVDYDDGFGYVDPISAMFDDFFGDPISDLLGGLFGINLRPTVSDSEPHKNEKRKSKSMPVVEVNKVEILDENGNPIKDEHESKTHKNPFKRNNKNN